MKIRLWVVAIIVVGLCIAITGFSVFGATYTTIQNQRNVFYQNVGATVKSFMISNVQRLLDNLYEAALVVQLSEPFLTSCSMPNSSYNQWAL